MKRLFSIIIAILVIPLVFMSVTFPNQNENEGLSIWDVSISKQTFNPTRGEEVEIIFTLTQSAEVTIKIFDPDYGLVRSLITEKKSLRGINSEKWDGNDNEGIAVPNEAYFFTISAKNKEKRVTYDPTLFSGGKEIFVDDASFDQANGFLNYILKKPSRILIRTGIKNGPLMRTIVNWKSQTKGENTVYWNGMDDSGVINITSLPGYSLLITGFEFTDNTVITYGNNRIDYIEYKTNKDSEETKERSLMPRKGITISKHYFKKRLEDRDPGITIKFPFVKEMEEIPELRGRVIVQVDLDEADKRYFTKNQFEVIFSIDGQYFEEETNGYVPYNWVWDTTKFPDGLHYLTVNVASLTDQIGASSLKAEIKNSK